jgi:tetratricopeptide (TPR) repeat protein
MDRRVSRSLYFEALDANLTRGWAPLRGVIADGWKLIDLPIPELYDLEKDPGETRNRAAHERKRSQLLQARLKEAIAREGSAAEPARALIDAESSRQLASLGYLGSVPTSEERAFSEADDPKNLVTLNEAFFEAIQDRREGRSDSALAKLEAVLTSRADFVAARVAAAAILESAGRPDEAILLLQSAPNADRSATVQTQLGLAFEASGNQAEAVKCLEAAIRLQEDPQTLNSLGVVYSRTGRFEDGRRVFRRVLATDPRAAAVWNNLGILEMSAGNPAGAAEAFHQAVEADPDYAGAWQRLGVALLGSDPAGAVQAWERAVALDPGDFDTMFNLGIVLAESPEPRKALPYLKRFVAEAPPERFENQIARLTPLIQKIERP